MHRPGHKNHVEMYDIMMEQLLRAIRKYDPDYKGKMKQVVEKIDEKLADRSQFSTADLNRYLGFDAVKYLRNLVGRSHLASVGKGVFERAAWPPPDTLLEGEPIGLTYCVQTWFKYYLQQWITNSMSQLETKEGVYSQNGFDFRCHSAHGSSGRRNFVIRPASGRVVCRLNDNRRGPFCRRSERFEIRRGRLRQRVELSQQILHVLEFHPQCTPVQLHVIGQQSSVMRRPDWNSDTGTRAGSADLFQRFDEALPAPLLQCKFRAGFQRLELPQQVQAIDEKRAAGLVSAEVM